MLWTSLNASLCREPQKLCQRTVIRCDFPGGPVAKTLHSQCRESRFNFWSGNQILHATTKTQHSQIKINKLKKLKTMEKNQHKIPLNPKIPAQGMRLLLRIAPAPADINLILYTWNRVTQGDKGPQRVHDLPFAADNCPVCRQETQSGRVVL